MGKRRAFLLIAALAAGSVQAAEYGDIEIVRADEKGILFEYRPVNVRLEMAPAFDSTVAGRPLQRLAIGNCARTVAEGNYDLPVRIVLVGIPADARTEIVAFAEGEASLAAANAAKNGRMIDRENLKTADSYALNEEKTGMENRVVPDRPFWIGNQRVLRLKLFPARYDEAARAYRVVEKLRVEVRSHSWENFASTPTPNRWEKVLSNGLLNYEQVKEFRSQPERNEKLAKAAAFSSPFSQSPDWVKVTFTDNGIYKIDRAMLSAAGVPVSTIDPRSIRMFCQGGRALPAFNNVPRPAWRELALEVTGEQDGIFDGGDEIHFYGWGVEGWDYDALGGNFSFAKNNYTTTQVFWLNWGDTLGLRAGSQNVAPVVGPPIVSSFPARFRLEQDRFLAGDNSTEINDYYNWYGGRGNSQTYFFTLPDLVSDIDTVKVKHLSGAITLRVNGVSASFLSTSSGLTLFQTGALKAGLNRVDLTLNTASNIFNHFDFLEAHYNRAPVYSPPLMEFETPAASGMVPFQIGASPQSFVLWDITNRSNPIALSGAVRNASGVLSFDVDATTKRLFVLTSVADFKRPTLLRQTPADLTGPNRPNEGEFVVIAPAAFQSALADYTVYRASHSNLTVEPVHVEQIYNNFSGGLPDPVAIRDFLKFARENWSAPPRYVLLVGDATYDFRNITGAGAVNYVPPFIVDQAFDPSSNSDEGFLYFSDREVLDSADQFLDMTVARWPVKNVSELQVIADKIQRYETSPEYGIWRNRATLVADDEFGLFTTEGFHTISAETLSNSYLPDRLDQKKIYLFDYPFDGLRAKPEAEEAIVRTWNEGHLVVDYIGHGNPNVWAHEHVFKREEDVPRLANAARLPLVYAASCNINTFAEPLADGMGEDLMKNPNGGAVAVIAAVRLVFAGSNEALNVKVLDLLFDSDSLSIGEAFYLAKLLRQNSQRQTNDNDRRYVLFGDPAMHLARPTYEINLTVQPDSLSALVVDTVSGEVTDSAGNVITGFNGTVTLSVFDGLRSKTHLIALPSPPGGFRPVDYNLAGNMIYRGEAAVTAGRFQFQFVVPKDISYGSRTGRISAYAWNIDGDAAGYKDSVTLSGSAAASNDTTGPRITLSAAGGALVGPGDALSAGLSLSVKLEDSSGINITGDPAHLISADFDFPSGPRLDLTESFRYEPGSFSSGQAAFNLPALSTGRHTLRVKAWDGANNSAVLEMPVEIVATGKLKLTEVLNYPNPMKENTNFCYILSAAADEVIIDIYSLAGRLVRSLRSTSARAGYNFGTTWDGRDNDGDRVASGVYIYKIRARQASKETEEFGKLVVMR
ncbi:MAG: type IX secretion system sortase PorU [candidate division Zixibacteria bacterium]|nr:type IX secretion system sortase PorU [candidate division Zixibacteria bacterium]